MKDRVSLNINLTRTTCTKCNLGVYFAPGTNLKFLVKAIIF